MSLRARLVLAVALVALVALGVAGVATYTAYTRSQVSQIDSSLQRSHEPIEEAVRSGSADTTAAVERAAPGLFVAVLASDRSVIVQTPAREAGKVPLIADLDDVALPPPTTGDPIDRPSFSTVSAVDGSASMRVRTSRLANGDVLVIGVSLHEAERSQRSLVVIEVIVAMIALLVAGGVGWILVRVGLRPLQRMEQAALSIAGGGDLDLQVPGGERPTEIGRLATAMNTMLTRIRGAFAERDETEQALRSSEERMRRFVADVSHELRTPVAAVSAYVELVDRGARDRPADLERALHGIALESSRMRGLVEELLLLARLDEGRPLARERVDLDEVVVEAIAAAQAVSPQWPIALHATKVVSVEGDVQRIRQIVDNLLANVRMHTPPGTTTTVSIDADASAVMSVGDDGPGMSAGQAAHVFERFFRADPSRSRASGGAGLGLAIVAALVDAHHGSIRVETAPGRGTVFTVSLPLAPDQHDG